MRYYFRDNRPSPVARFFLSGAVLLALISAIGGFYYSKGLPFATNPFAGFHDDVKGSGTDEEDLEPIFIPIRKKFPPDPFPGGEKKTSGKTAPAEPSTASAVTRSQTAVPAKSEPVAPPVSVHAEQGRVSAVEPAKNHVAGKTDDSGVQNKPVELATTNASEENPSNSTPVEIPSGIASMSGDKVQQTEARSLASVRQASSPSRPEPAKVKQIVKSEPVKPADSVKPGKVARPVKAVKSVKPVKKTRSKPAKSPTKSSNKRKVAVIRPKPANSTPRTKVPAEVAVQASSADSKSVSRSEQPKYRNLDTVVEISDSGETVAGKRWKDISSASD
ncbi:MAG: hypothetical protein DSZ32_05835 [Gammaproteobacteria bacterium]|nr:MAG: hypothetical protein DSZ32_05835 [Gammaproteobacteria bacterium]